MFLNMKKGCYWDRELQLHMSETKEKQQLFLYFVDCRQKECKNFNKFARAKEQKSRLLKSLTGLLQQLLHYVENVQVLMC